MNRIGTGLWLLGLGLATALGCGDNAKPAQAPAAMGGAGEGGAAEGGGAGAADAGHGEGGSLAPATGGEGGAAGAAGAAGELGLGGAGDMSGPCQGISTQGECTTPTQARTCVVPTGNGQPTLVTTDCRGFEHCEVGKLQTRCVVNKNACLPGHTACVGPSQLRTCDANGVGHTQTCASACQSSAVGAFCISGSANGTFQGTLEYQVVPVYDDYSDWADNGDPVFKPAQGVLVLSGNGSEWLDAAFVDENGAFSLNVPTSNTGLEQLAFFTLHPDSTGANVELGVYNPDVADGVASTEEQLTGTPWSWSMPLANISSGEGIRIDEAQGSGAIHVYTRLLIMQGIVRDFYQAAPGSIVAWMHLNTEWDCGACFAPWPTDVSGTPFDSQLFISATAQDRAYWSDAVTVHESGHYAMWSYGLSPNEGGTHCLGKPTAPGQAWSEGWATGFSSILRESPIYYDKQQGSMFWFDLGLRKYDALSWVRPKPGAGLLQDIDENEVAAMLWGLSKDPSIGSDATLAGLQTPSVTVPSFKRGYTRHVWDMQDCTRFGYHSTGESSPMFADYLDGLVCGGVPAASIDATTNPQQAYPYPSGAPLCP
jgi:hypothetical protein